MLLSADSGSTRKTTAWSLRKWNHELGCMCRERSPNFGSVSEPISFLHTWAPSGAKLMPAPSSGRWEIWKPVGRLSSSRRSSRGNRRTAQARSRSAAAAW